MRFFRALRSGWREACELRLNIFANGWKEKRIEGGIDAAVTRLSFSQNQIQMRGTFASDVDPVLASECYGPNGVLG
jgi:hypothetical protein